MKDYNKNYFWTTVDPVTAEKKYYFRINGIMVEVTKEVYNVCFSSYVKSLRECKRSSDNPSSSLDAVNQDGHSLIDVIESDYDLEEEVYTNLMVNKLKQEINNLNEDEKIIIYSILNEDKTINQLSNELDIPYMTLSRKKNKILENLKKKLKNGENTVWL